MFKLAAAVLVGVWTATIVGVAVLAVRFYLGERRREAPASAGRPVSPAEAVGARRAPTFALEPEPATGGSQAAATLPDGPFIVLPGSRRKRRSRRRIARHRHQLVR